MKIYIIAFVFLCSSFALAEQKVSGVLLERGTKAKLDGVNVFILPHKLKATTDREGRFEFEAVPDGPFELVVNNPGYLKLVKEVDDPVADLSLYLEKELYGVFETTVTALANRRDVTKKSMTQEEFLKAPGAQDDPLKAVQNLPGIANQSFSSAVVIQGSSPDDTRYSLNGHEIPIVFHFGGLSSIVMPQAVKTVDYLASGYGPEYGRALGGIINLETRDPKSDRWQGMGFVDIYNAGAVVEGPINETSSIFLSTRYSYIGQVIKAAAEESDAFDLTVAPTFTDSFVQYTNQLTEKDKLTLIAIRSEDELKFVLDDPAGGNNSFRGTFYQNTQFYRIIPRWQRQLSPDQSLDLSVGYGDNNILFEVGDNYFDLQTSSLTQRTELKTKHNSWYTSYLGLDLQWTSYDAALRFPEGGGGGAPSGDVSQTRIAGEDWQNAIYLRNAFSLMEDNLYLYPSLRLSYFTATEETYVMPRVSVAYKLSSSLTSTFAAGLYYQAPQNGEAQEDTGNPDITAEQATHYTIGLEKDFRGGSSNGFLLTMDVFYKELQDLIVGTSELNADSTPKINANDGTGTIYGQQTQLKWKWRDLSIVGAYTYLKSQRTEPERGEFPSEYDQTHNLNVIASYDYGRWVFSSRFRYVTGRPYTPVTGALYDSDGDSFIPIQGEFFSQRYDDFLQLDLRFDRKWIYDTWILSGYLDIQNVTNNGNVEAISYNYDYSGSEKITGLPILPIIGLKGEF